MRNSRCLGAAPCTVRRTSVLALADDVSLSSLTIRDPVRAPVKALNPTGKQTYQVAEKEAEAVPEWPPGP